VALCCLAAPCKSFARDPAPTGESGGVLLVRHREVTLSIEHADKVAEALLDKARKVGGQLEERKGNRLVLGVPGPRLGELEALIAELGEIKSQSAGTSDVALEVADLEAALRAVQQQRASLESMLGRARSVDESLLVERRLAEVEQKAIALRTKLHAVRRLAAGVRVAITLAPRPVEPIPGVQLPFPWLSTLSEAELRNPSVPPDEPFDSGGIDGNVDMALELEGRQMRDRPERDDVSRALALVLRLRGARTDPVGFAGAYDVKLGGLDGVVYEMRGLAGLGTSIGGALTLGLLGGAGVSGWTGERVPSSLEIPLELFVLVDFGDALRFSAFAQPRWTVTRDARRDGAEHGLFADELALGSALLLPQVFGQNDVDEGGLRVGFEYTELLATKMYSLTLGIGFGFPSRR
jgi:hypothetical protein